MMKSQQISRRGAELAMMLRNLRGGLVVVLAWSFSLAALAFASGDLRLVEAVKERRKDAVFSLLNQKADVNVPLADGSTALHWAVHWDDFEVVELLIRAGANVNAANAYGVTPLFLACQNRNAAVVEKLLRAGTNANAALVRTAETVLMACARTGSLGAVKLLVAHGAEVNAKETWQGQTALMWAVAERHLEVAPLLVEHGADINARSKSGFTPLLFAARNGDMELIRVLLEMGADVNQAAPEDGPPLVVVAASGHEKAALFLLEKGADPNASDAYGRTALHYAIQKGLANLSFFEYTPYRLPPPNMSELVKALLASGANPNARIAKNYPSHTRAPFRQTNSMSVIGATPLFLAATSGDASLMRVLLASGADPSLGTVANVTPLMVAAGMGRAQDFLEGEEPRQLEAVQLLVELGASINAEMGGAGGGATIVRRTGQTALHAAAFTGSDSIVQFLVDKGASVNATAANGQTPWTIAEAIAPVVNQQGSLRLHKSTADLLLKLGAVPLSVEDIVPVQRGSEYRVDDKGTGKIPYPLNPRAVPSQ